MQLKPKKIKFAPKPLPEIVADPGMHLSLSRLYLVDLLKFKLLTLTFHV